MGTTRIKVIDLSSDQKEIKTSRKHARLASQAKRAEKLAGALRVKKEEEKPKAQVKQEVQIDQENTEVRQEQNDSAEKEDAQKPKETTAQAKAQKPDENPKGIKPKVKTESTHHTGKKYKEAKKLIEDKQYAIGDALALLPKTSTVRFDPSVEIHFTVADKNVKGSVNFPHAVDDNKKKEIKYLIFSDSQTAKGEGVSIIWGNDLTISEIEAGRLKPKKDFDVVIASPKFMPNLAKIAKILGPAGLMPNPKNGTVTNDFQKALKSEAQSGYRLKLDPNAPVVHAKIGKLSQGEKNLEENLKALILAIGATKIKKGYLTTAMGPSIKLDITTI